MFKKTLFVIALSLTAQSTFTMNTPVVSPAAPAVASGSVAGAAAGVAVLALAASPAGIVKGGCLLASAAFKYVIVPGSIYVVSSLASAASKALTK